jgi:nuclear transport factor 2 (NTF2) superfamily protein
VEYALIVTELSKDTRDPRLVSPAYTPDSLWRNRDEFFSGREAIESFLTRKWEKEKNYRLRKELFAFQDNRMCLDPPRGDAALTSQRGRVLVRVL